MAHIGENLSKMYNLLSVHEHSGNLSLHSRSHDVFNNLGKDVDGAVEELVIARPEKVKATSATASFRFNKVGGIGVSLQDHVTRAVKDFSIGV